MTDPDVRSLRKTERPIDAAAYVAEVAERCDAVIVVELARDGTVYLSTFGEVRRHSVAQAGALLLDHAVHG